MNETLRKIQTELKAPKNQWNDYGKYHYRNAEGILDAVKPLLEKYGADLYLTDRIDYREGRWYLVARAFFESQEGIVSVEGWAREPESKKGMDDSQITGTASSYARKYALNGLFLIDDAKDADTNEFRKEVQKRAEEPKIESESIDSLRRFASEVGVSIDAICQRYGVMTLQDLTQAQYVDAVRGLEKNAERMNNARNN